MTIYDRISLANYEHDPLYVTADEPVPVLWLHLLHHGVVTDAALCADQTRRAVDGA